VLSPFKHSVHFGTDFYSRRHGNEHLIRNCLHVRDLRVDGTRTDHNFPESEWNLPKLHSLNIITDVLTAVVVTTLYKHLGITTFPAAFPYVFWLWLGLSAAPVFNAYGWGHRRLSFFLIETLHVFVSLLILTWVYFLVA